jgi:decaprenylphospho-beta-D-ribofuranose 2-oxidase
MTSGMPPHELRSFDGMEVVRSRIARPERYRDLRALLESGPCIPRGAGLSYSAASMGEAATSVDMTRFDRVLGFDEVAGTVTLEAGVRIGALTDFLAARGHYLPVLPGYPAITVGGCIAFDVHGKSQHHSGNFSELVRRLTLVHPARGTLDLGPTLEPDLFDLTLGGLGLTGVITRVTLAVKPLPGPCMAVDAVPCRHLGDAVDMMRRRADDVDALYSWHDFNRARGFGRGVVFVERFVERGTAARGTRERDPAYRGRFGLWNSATTRLALRGYVLAQRLRKQRTLDIREAMFPIAGLERYYWAFGRPGFREYQMLVPYANWDSFQGELEPTIRASRVPVTLASLKLFRGRPRNLAFSGEGVCVAVDVPAGSRADRLFARLDELAVKHAAVINLSKDSRAGAELCRAVFPAYAEFATRLTSLDPKRLAVSRLRERVGV